MQDEKPMTVKQAAEHLGVRQETIRRWIKEGKLHAVLMGGNRAGYRIEADEVRRLLRGK